MVMLKINFGVKDKVRLDVISEWLEQHVPEEYAEPIIRKIINEEQYFPKIATLNNYWRAMDPGKSNRNQPSRLERMRHVRSFRNRGDCYYPEIYCYTCEGVDLGCMVYEYKFLNQKPA